MHVQGLRGAQKRQRLKVMVDYMMTKMEAEKTEHGPEAEEPQVMEFTEGDARTTVVTEPLEL